MLNELVSSTSWIENYIRFLIKPIEHHNFGLGWNVGNFTVCVNNVKGSLNYHLKFSIPYANQNLQWEVLFNPLHPDIGPDFIFHEEENKNYENIDSLAKSLTSLIQWNSVNDNSLLDTIIEFLHLYKEYQVNLLKMSDKKIASNYNSLELEMQSQNIEVACIQNGKAMEIKLLINLNPDLSHLWFKKVSNKKVLLFFDCVRTSSNPMIPELYLSDVIQNLFDESEPLCICPLYNIDQLAEYAARMKQSITKKIHSLLDCLEKRKIFISTLLVLQKATVIEYDISAYKQAALYLKYNNFGFILVFLLPNNFPIIQFSMKLHSVNHMTEQGLPIQKVVQRFPYCPRWEPKQMISKAISHIFKQEIKRFL